MTKKELTEIKNKGAFEITTHELCAMRKEYLEYKDIEQELGIDLITLFKILKEQQIIDKYKGCISGYSSNLSCGWFEINYNNKCIIYNVVRNNEYQLPKYYYFDNYGKTWALTKEELEQ